MGSNFAELKLRQLDATLNRWRAADLPSRPASGWLKVIREALGMTATYQAKKLGVTTSTVTVPIVAALGLGLAAAVPGRNPAIDGFGLIAFASLFPIITVLGYGQYAQWMNHRARRQIKEKHHEI